MYSAKDLKKYDEGMVTDSYIYDKCDTDLDMYNFYANHCGMSENVIKDAMRDVSGADDAYYNALDLAEYYNE
jgi:hypothetical protein